MNFKQHKLICLLFSLSFGMSQGLWVKYGWELFGHVTDARTASLGQATVAYPLNTPTSTLMNPTHSSINSKLISATHQSRFAGILNNDLVGFQFNRQNTPLVLNVLYEGIGQIPDTRNMLLDWGNDGQFGTNDPGEGNGILDEGERLDADQLKFFSQHQLGLHLAFNRSIKQIPVGIGVKLLSYSLDEHAALGVGIDFGMVKNIKGNRIGMVVRNFPASGLIWNNGTVEGTTPSMSLGIHRNIQLKQFPLELHSMFQWDASTASRHLDSQIGFGDFSVDAAFGLEAVYHQKLFIRMGRNALNNTTGGLGVQWSGFGVDYAFQMTQTIEGLGNHHLISLNVGLDWLKKTLTQIQ